jgi:hypothetical protein
LGRLGLEGGFADLPTVEKKESENGNEKIRKELAKQIGCTAQRMPIGLPGMAMGSAEPKEWFP